MKIKNVFINILVVIAVLALAVTANRTCQDIQEPGASCEVRTPVINSCSTYDLYNSTYELTIDDGSMAQIGSTGVYYFNFLQRSVGTYKVIICDRSLSSSEILENYNQSKKSHPVYIQSSPSFI